MPTNSVQKATAANKRFGNIMARRKYNRQFVNPGRGSGWTYNFHHQILTSTKYFNQQGLWVDGILISPHRYAVVVMRNAILALR